MKILYTANEQDDAQLAATALRGIAQDVTLTWTASLREARWWVTENQDLDALVVEAHIQNQPSAPLVGYVRSLGLKPLILVVVPEDGQPPLAALKAGADDYLVRNHSLGPSLTAAFKQSLRQAHPDPRSQPLRLLYVGDAALAKSSLDRAPLAIEITEAPPGSNGHLDASFEASVPFDALLLEHDRGGPETFAFLKNVVRRRPSVPVILVVEWDEELALPALKLGAADYVLKNKASFRALFYQLDRQHRNGSDRAPKHPDRDTAAANARVRASEAEWESTIERERRTVAALEERLATSEAARRQAEQLRASAEARYDNAARQASDASEAGAVRERLERQLAEGHTARVEAERRRADAEERAAAERTAAQRIVERQRELDSRLHREIGQREALAQKLTAAETAHREAETARHEAETARRAAEAALYEAKAALHQAERSHASEATTAATQLADLRRLHDDTTARLAELQSLERKVAESEEAIQRLGQERTSEAEAYAEQIAQRDEAFAVSLSRVIHTRDAVERQLNEARQALEQSNRERTDEARAAADLLAKRETELASAEESAARLERRLAVAEALLQEGVAERESAAGRLTTLEAQLAEEHEARQTLAQQWALAEERHASASEAAVSQLRDQQVHYEARLAEAAATRDAVDQHVKELTATLDELQQEHLVESIDTMERLSRLEAELGESVQTRQTLEHRLAEAETALVAREQRAAAQRLAAEHQAGRREAEIVALLDVEAANRKALEQAVATAQKNLSEAETAHLDATARHASTLAAAAAEFAERQAQFEARLTEAAASREGLELQLRQMETSLTERGRDLFEAVATRRLLEERLASATRNLEAANERAAAERLSAEQLAERQRSELARFAEQHGDFEARLRQMTSEHASLERTLADAQERHAAEARETGERFASRQREYESRLATATEAREAVDRKLHAVVTALDQARREHAVEMTAAAEQLTRAKAQLAQAVAQGDTVAHRLTDVTAALQAAEQLTASTRLAAAEEAGQRQAEFDTQLAREVATRLEHEQKLTQAGVALAALEHKLTDAESQRAAAMEAADWRLRAQHDEYEARLAQASADREVLDHQLRETAAALERIRQQSASDAIAAASRVAQRESELAAALSARQDSEARLAAAETALDNAEATVLAERTATAQQTAARWTEFEARLAHEVEARNVLERELAETHAAAEQARRTALSESAAQAEEGRQREARLTEQLARERSESEARLADQQERIEAFDGERDALQQSLRTSQERLRDVSRALEDAKAHFESVQLSKDAELQRLGQDHTTLRSTLDQVRSDGLQMLERLTSDHAAELAAARALIADRDGQVKDQAARHAAAQQAAHLALSKLEHEFNATLAARSHQIDRLQSELDVVTREAEAARGQRDVLKGEADRAAVLAGQLEASRDENRRRFDQSIAGILRCSREGTLLEANQALLRVLGYRHLDELRGRDIGASVFESADELRGLLERREGTSRQPVECIWKKKDGSRLIMRLQVGLVSADAFEITTEDLTSVRGLEERLRRAQRMEAVGRLASEVAVTCDTLLRNVNRDALEWLATFGNGTAQRHQGELIFGEVSRAAGFLRQLSVYGQEQSAALEPVDLTRVLRNLEPVLKRLAGEDIEFVLPKKNAALNVDVDAERVERVLVNVAAYGRARLPAGGRLIVHAARVTLDSEFVTKYPNVRPGAHALITIIEVRDPARADAQIDQSEKAAHTAARKVSDHPGVDLGTLQALIRDCGGHLWMDAEPGGNLRIKIHLPLRSVEASGLVGVARAAGIRSVGRLFQS